MAPRRLSLQSKAEEEEEEEEYAFSRSESSARLCASDSEPSLDSGDEEAAGGAHSEVGKRAFFRTLLERDLTGAMRAALARHDLMRPRQA